MRQLIAEQQRTALEVRMRARELKATRKTVGGLSEAVGYALEDRAIRSRPLVLPQVAGIQLGGSLQRDFLQDALGEEIEVNLLGYGTTAEGETVTVIGETRARLRMWDLESLLKSVERLRGTGVLRVRIQPILVGYLLRGEVQRKA